MEAEEKPTLLLLGGSSQQLVAIETAKRLGCRTVLCDYLEDNPGQYCVDSFHLVSTTDRESVLEVARAESVDGVLAYASDPAAPTAAYVAERLGLPTNPFASVEILSSKHLFRQHLQKMAFPCPRIMKIPADSSDEEILGLIGSLRFPFVVKPTDSSGSKGVTVVGCVEEALPAVAYARRFSRNRILIAEEYIERTFPYVIGGDIFVVDGVIRFWGLMSCLRDDDSSLVPVGKKMPSGLNVEQYAKVKDVLQRLVASLDIRFGELNVEVILGRDGLPYVLEMGARAGGNMIPLQLSDVSGIDLVAANVACTIGADPGEIQWECDGRCCATYVLHSLEDGIFERCEYSNEIGRHIYRTEIYKKPGDSVGLFDGAGKAIGIVFMRFDSWGEMNRFLSDVDLHIRVVLRGGL